MGDEKKSFAVGKVRITGETASKDLPELFHTFKPEQDHGNLLLAIIFTVLTMSPILVLGQLVLFLIVDKVGCQITAQKV